MDQILQKRIDEIKSKIESSDVVWLFRNASIEPIIQNGPQCGIVALCMALSYLNMNCGVDELVSEAKQANFTISGEIFDIEYLFVLAKNRYKNCRLIHFDTDEAVYECLFSAKLVLIAYDCDFNFEPCFKKGKKAHWALITGYLLPVHKSSVESILSEDHSDCLIDLNHAHNDADRLFKAYRDEYCSQEPLSFSDNKSINNLACVVCRQGKSKSYGLWNFKKLLDSNRQLREIGEKRADESQYVRPKDGNLQSTLANKVLAIY